MWFSGRLPSTNLPDTLDKAITRRFDFSISFTYLTNEQIIAMIAAVTTENIMVTDAQIGHLQCITPADFSVAARQARLKGEKITVDSLLALLAELSLSRNGVSQRIGFL